MDTVIVTGAVVAFLLLIMPAVIVAFLSTNPSRPDAIVRPATRPLRSAAADHEPTDRIAA